jgi:TRAP-type C4-dicarboxylate transport system substrate-binding protein
MYEPILMSKKSFDALSSKQQKALMAAGKVAEQYMTEQVANLDKKFEDAYKAAGVELVYMTAEDHAAWIEIAKKSSHKAFAEQVPGGAKLMEMALAVK